MKRHMCSSTGECEICGAQSGHVNTCIQPLNDRIAQLTIELAETCLQLDNEKTMGFAISAELERERGRHKQTKIELAEYKKQSETVSACEHGEVGVCGFCWSKCYHDERAAHERSAALQAETKLLCTEVDRLEAALGRAVAALQWAQPQDGLISERKWEWRCERDAILADRDSAAAGEVWRAFCDALAKVAARRGQ